MYIQLHNKMLNLFFKGFNNSGLIQNFRNNSTELGLTPRQNGNNFLSPIGVAPDAPVARSRSVNHLHVNPILPQDDLKRKSMQHFGSNISLASHVFPQRKYRKSNLFSPFFFPHFLLFLITAKWFKISYSGFLCSFQGQGGQLLILFTRWPPPIFKACVCSKSRLL